MAAAVQAAEDELRAGGLPVRAEVRRGDPALVLAHVAAQQNARLIVVGAGERAPCDVLIVRPRARER